MYYSTEQEWQQAVDNINRKVFESTADLIGKIAKYRYCVKHSSGIQQEIYKKELKKLNKQLEERGL